MNKSKSKETLKGSLSVLKLIPGTYFNQTGNPLLIAKKTTTLELRQLNLKRQDKSLLTQNSTRHKHKAQCEDEHINQLCVLSSRISPNHFSHQNHTEEEELIVKHTKRQNIM